MDRETSLREIRVLAEEYVRENLPDEHPYFDLIWDQIEHPLSMPAGNMPEDKHSWLEHFIPKGLGFAEARTPSIVTPAVILTLETAALELGASIEEPTKVQIVEALSRCAQIFGTPKDKAQLVARKLAGSIEKNIRALIRAGKRKRADMLPVVEAPFEIWTSRESGIGSTHEGIFEPEIGDHVNRMTMYDIFVHSGTVYSRIVDGKMAPVGNISDFLVNLLILFLKYKDVDLGATELYHVAGCKDRAELNRNMPVGSRIDSYKDCLRTPVSRLRDTVGVKSMEIKSVKLRGYCCKGLFKFCMLLPSDADRRLRIPSLER